MVWSSVEISVGVICACLPAIVPVLQLISRKLRDVASQKSTKRQSRGLWYAQSVARGGNRENKPDENGMYGPWDEELATLRPVYGNSIWASERRGIGYGVGPVDDSRSVPVTTMHSTNSSN